MGRPEPFGALLSSVNGVMGPSYGPTLRGRQDSKLFGTGLPIIPCMSCYRSVIHLRIHLQPFTTDHSLTVWAGLEQQQQESDVIGPNFSINLSEQRVQLITEWNT